MSCLEGIKLWHTAIIHVINCIMAHHYTNGLVQERRNSSALAMELCLSCINHWYEIWDIKENFWKFLTILSHI